jgi:hypothetical protein
MSLTIEMLAVEGVWKQFQEKRSSLYFSSDPRVA